MDQVRSSAHAQQPSDIALITRLKEIKIFDKKWELLKDVLEPLFAKESVDTIANAMERRFNFRANEEAYKYRFKRWGWTGKKNSARVPKPIKQYVLSRAQKRMARGTGTVAEYQGQAIHPHRLQSEVGPLFSNDKVTVSEIFRGIGGNSQHFGSYMPFSDSLLLIWDMPFGARPSALTPPWMRPSPSVPGETPDGLIIATPTNSAHTPTGAEIVRPSLTPAVQLQRARMMVQGKFQDMLKSMDVGEQKTLSTWLYQYRYFAFVTAQEWGKGPLHWTKDNLHFADYGNAGPASLTNTPHNNPSPGTPGLRHVVHEPPSTCRWSIHVDDDCSVVEALPENNPSGNDWSRQNLSEPVEERLMGALLSNSFSDLTEAQLPVSVSKVVKAARRSPSDLVLESLGFAIMGRSIELVQSCIDKAEKQLINIATIHPLHIAASYLDGSKTCCLIMDELCRFLKFEGHYKDCITNEHGHTVLDNLFLSVLRSHSTAPLSIVERSFGERARYAGSEVDICGRWSADSHCYRTLLACGERTIPPTWKHKFCHTSIQAVCHTIGVLRFTVPTSTVEKSGLFRHTCPNESCGRRMQLGPLHTLVVVAMFLATYGCADEDLLGIIACYLCMTREDVDPLESACLSVPEILGFRTDDICIHSEMIPSELAVQLRQEMSSFPFRNAVTTGWNCLVTIMRMAESARMKQTTMASPGSNTTDSDSIFGEIGSPGILGEYNLVVADEEIMDCRQDDLHPDDQEEHALCGIEFGGECFECDDRAICEDFHLFQHSSGLGHAWAVIQAELSNYRRLDEGDKWSSPYFSVEGLLQSLTTDESLDIAYIKNDMLRPYCGCGRYLEAPLLPLRQDMFTEYSSNMDGRREVWERTYFIGQPLQY